MKKILFLLMMPFVFKGQDTIYADAYPTGIISDRDLNAIDFNDRKITLKKGELEIVIRKDELIKVTNKGVKYENPNYISSGLLVVPTEISSGKFYFSEVVAAKGVKKNDLYNSLKGLPNSSVTFVLLADDETEKTSLTYRAVTYVKFAGDLHTMFFTLKIWFKDEKVKYEMSDFRLFYSEDKKINMLGNQNYSTGATHIKNNPLETYYTRGHRERFTEFWGTNMNNINTTINTIKTSVNRAKTNADW